MALNIITASFGSLRSVTTAPAWQYDYGQILQIEGLDLPSVFEVHFANSPHSGTATTQIGQDGAVSIPDAYLTSGADVYAWIFLHEADTDGETEYSIRIPVKDRPIASDTQPDPVEQSAITQAIAALNDAVEQTGEDKAATAALAEAAAASSLIATQAAQAIEAMTVSSQTLAAGSSATVTKTESGGVVNLEFGIPKGEAGITPDLTIGTVQTLPAGSQATAEITGTDEEPVLNLGLPQGADGDVSDVQINGTSIVNQGVATIPLASPSAYGVTKGGRTTVSGTTPSITAEDGVQYICGEVSTLDITLPDSGIVDVVFTSGATATVLTVTPPTGQTVRWANGFDPTSLEANTVYEINILNGLGVYQTWSTS